MQKPFTIEEEILLNQFTQQIHSLAYMKDWFAVQDDAQKKYHPKSAEHGDPSTSNGSRNCSCNTNL